MHPYHFRNHHLHQEVAGNVFQKYSIYNVILLYFLNTLYYIIFLNVKCTYMFDKQYIFGCIIFSVGREIFLSPTLNIIQPKKMKETGMTDKQFSGFLRMLIDRLEDTKSENGSYAKDKKLDKIISDLRKTIDEIMTTRPTGGLLKCYKPKSNQPASKGAGFHSVQARILTRLHPLNGIYTTCNP